jgi:hypothetical protein
MKIVWDVLGVARSHVHVRVHRPASWTDRRRNRRPRDDGKLVAKITHEIATLPAYGYRRAWTMVNGRRDGAGRRRVNHKRVYRVMRDYRLLFGGTPGDPSIPAATTAGLRSARATIAGAPIARDRLPTSGRVRDNVAKSQQARHAWERSRLPLIVPPRVQSWHAASSVFTVTCSCCGAFFRSPLICGESSVAGMRLAVG